MSNVPKLRFKEFSKEWEEKILGDIGKVTMCKRIMKDQTLSSGDIPFYKIGTFGKVADAYISNELYQTFKAKYSYPNQGDILIAASGATYGKTVVFDGSPSYFQDSNIVWIANDEKLVYNSFLNFIYRKVKWKIEESTIPRLYNGVISSTFLNIPSLKEQEKIASFLTSVDTKIEQLTKKEKLLQQYKKGVMQKIFNQEIRFKADDGSEFPEWNKTTVSHCLVESKIKGDTGLNAKKLTVKLWNKGVFEKNESLAGSENTNYYIRNAGQFIYSKLDFLNCAFGIIPEHLDGFQSTIDLPCFDFVNDTNPLFFLMRVTRKDFYLKYGEQADGSRKARRINQDTFFDMPISLPSPEEQIKIANFLSSIDSKIEQVQNQLKQTKEFKKALLQQMFV